MANTVTALFACVALFTRVCAQERGSCNPGDESCLAPNVNALLQKLVKEQTMDPAVTAESSSGAILQSLKLQPISKESLNDDADAAKNGDTMAAYSQTAEKAFSQGGASIQHMDTKMDEYTQLLSVKFRHQDKDHEFQVAPHNLYTGDAQVRLGAELLEMEPPRTYRARVNGKWASMTLHKDGSLQGLFQDGDRVIQITPSSHHKDDDIVAALLESYDGTGEGQPHLVQWVEVPRLGGSSMLQAKEIPGPEEGPDGEIDNMPVDTIGDGARSEEETGANNNWAGTQWAGSGGCYTGDQDMHEMILGIYSDEEAFDKAGRNETALQAKLESAVNQASFVYEMQMNFMLKIGDMQMSTDPSKFGGCPASDEMGNKLQQMRSAVDEGTIPLMASSHIFTGCGLTYGVVGLAYVGTICRQSGGANTGSNKIHTSSPWLTFCHELGHNLDGAHSFEDGQGSTGGIMDYGDGLLRGHYQFNTKYRKTTMCSKLNSVVNTCGGKFQKDQGGGGGGGGGGTPATPLPTAALIYTMGADNSNTCPSSSQLITTLSACQAAAAGKGFDGPSAEDEAHYPKGCYLYNGVSVWFNSHAAGQASAVSALICASSSGSPPRRRAPTPPPPTPSPPTPAPPTPSPPTPAPPTPSPPSAVTPSLPTPTPPTSTGDSVTVGKDTLSAALGDLADDNGYLNKIMDKLKEKKEEEEVEPEKGEEEEEKEEEEEEEEEEEGR